jgi:hypothetical protein
MSEVTLSMPGVDELRAQAKAIAEANPPSRVALTVISGFFAMFGWIAGRAWYLSFGTVAFIGLAVKYGYWNGAKVPPAQRVKRPVGAQPRQ